MLDSVPAILKMARATVPSNLNRINLMSYMINTTAENILKNAMVTYNGPQSFFTLIE